MFAIISLEHISKSIEEKERKLDILIDGYERKCIMHNPVTSIYGVIAFAIFANKKFV